MYLLIEVLKFLCVLNIFVKHNFLNVQALFYVGQEKGERGGGRGEGREEKRGGGGGLIRERKA